MYMVARYHSLEVGENGRELGGREIGGREPQQWPKVPDNTLCPDWEWSSSTKRTQLRQPYPPFSLILELCKVACATFVKHIACGLCICKARSLLLSFTDSCHQRWPVLIWRVLIGK